MNEWKLVPAEPTEAMIDAGCEIDARAEVQRRYAALYPDVPNPGVPAGEILKLRYASMLDAAPTPPVVLPPLTDDMIMSACYSFRHDFGLMHRHEQTALMNTAREWARCFGIK